jgi:phosphoserine phosphatase RsbU/P
MTRNTILAADSNARLRAGSEETTMNPNFRSRLSIKWILPPLIVLPVIIVAAVLITLDYRTSRRSVNELADENMQQIHRTIEEHLSCLMDLPPAINGLDRRMLETGQLSLTDVDRNRQTVLRTLRTFPAVSSIVIGNATGPTMWVIRYPGQKTYEYAIKTGFQAHMEEYALDDDGNINGPKLADYVFQPTKRPWYKAAIQADGPTWGNVYIWVRHGKGETLGVPYVEPYRASDGHILGVINTELTLADISSFLGQVQVGKTGKSFIVDRDGQLIANSVGLDCMTADLKRIPASSAADSWISAAAGELNNRAGSLAQIGQISHANMLIDNRSMRIVVSPYSNRRNLNWLIVTMAPDSDFLAQIDANRDRSIVLGIATVLLMLLVSIATVIAMLRPLLKLVHHVKQVGEGKLDDKLAINDSREMALLSKSINEMVDGLGDRMRLRHALNVAMDVQQSLLPSSTPSIPGVEVAAFSKYCDETGGDYYDYIDVAGMGENNLIIALGDVMGHGVAAAMLMATARGMLRSRVRVRGSLGDLLTHVNDLLEVDTGGNRFMTMLVGVIEVDAQTMRWSSAGHDAPFIYDPAADSFPELDVPTGLPLGVMADQPYEESVPVAFVPGQIMVISTDGLWEARNAQDDEFGRERLKQAIRELADRSAREIQIGLYERVIAHCGTNKIEDDVTYVVVKFVEKTVERRPLSEPQVGAAKEL